MKRPEGRTVVEWRCGLDHPVGARPYLGSVTRTDDGALVWHGWRPHNDQRGRWVRKNAGPIEMMTSPSGARFGSGPTYISPELQFEIVSPSGAVAAPESVIEIGCREHGRFAITVAQVLAAAQRSVASDTDSTVLVDNRHRRP